MAISLDLLPSALQNPNTNISALDTFSPLDVQDHSTPHMKTRVAVRDRTPHRFQIVPLKDAKRQPSDTATPLSSSRRGLKDITNSLLASSRSTQPPATIMTAKGTHIRQPFAVVDKTNSIETPSAENRKVSPVADVQSGFVSPLNIVKRSPPGDVDSTQRSTRLRSLTARSSSVKPKAAATSVRPVFDFLNHDDPAESTPTLPKYRRRSRSSNQTLTSHPTRTRMNSTSLEAGEFSDNHSTTPTLPTYTPTITSTTSKLTIPSLSEPLHLIAKDAVMTNISAKEPSTQNTFKTRIPSAKLKTASQPRALDHVPLHGTTRSMDTTSGILQTPRRRQAQNTRSVSHRCDETPQATDDKTTSSTEQHPILRAPIRLRNSINSGTPLEISKRHAIYTRSLYVGRAEKSSDNYIRALHDPASPPSLRRAFSSALAECSSRSQGDSLDSIVHAYENGAEPHCGLTTSFSEPTLHDISGLSFGLASDDIPSDTPGIIITGASISLSSLSSVYSQDSWEEERQNVLLSSSNEDNAGACTSLGDRRNVDVSHHPIVWDLLKKLESEEQSWWFDTGLDGKL